LWFLSRRGTVADVYAFPVIKVKVSLADRDGGCVLLNPFQLERCRQRGREHRVRSPDGDDGWVFL
jgi:hypothetical protein